MLTSRSIPHLLVRRAYFNPDKLCYRHKVKGIWRDVSWSRFYSQVRDVALGLEARGLVAGDRVAIMGSNDPGWCIADLATQAAGGISLGVDTGMTTSQIREIVTRARARFVFLQDRSQLRKASRALEQVDGVEEVYIWDLDERLQSPEGSSMVSLARLGLKSAQDPDRGFRSMWEKLEPDDPAILVCTSGTTGHPRLARLSHGNLLAFLDSIEKVVPFREGDSTVSFLPLSHVAERIFGLYSRLSFGISTTFSQGLAYLQSELREIRPTIFGSVPRVYEKIYQRVTEEATLGAPSRVKLVNEAIRVAREVSRLKEEGRRLPLFLRARWQLLDRLYYRHVREAFGGQLRFLITGAAPIFPGILRFFHGSGIVPLEFYGCTECSAACTGNSPGDMKIGSVGRPLPGIEVKLASDGEILVRGPTVFAGYHGDQEATSMALEDGWFHTGDLGWLDTDGYLWITDRKVDILVTSGGHNVAPRPVENQLIQHPLVARAVVLGHGRPYLVALLTLDESALHRLAVSKRLGPRLPEDLAGHPVVQSLISRWVDEVNGKLADFEQIRRFLVIPHPFTVASGELTSTQKVRRQMVEEHHSDRIEKLYD